MITSRPTLFSRSQSLSRHSSNEVPIFKCSNLASISSASCLHDSLLPDARFVSSTITFIPHLKNSLARHLSASLVFASFLPVHSSKWSIVRRRSLLTRIVLPDASISSFAFVLFPLAGKPESIVSFAILLFVIFESFLAPRSDHPPDNLLMVFAVQHRKKDPWILKIPKLLRELLTAQAPVLYCLRERRTSLRLYCIKVILQVLRRSFQPSVKLVRCVLRQLQYIALRPVCPHIFPDTLDRQSSKNLVKSNILRKLNLNAQSALRIKDHKPLSITLVQIFKPSQIIYIVDLWNPRPHICECP